MSIQWESLRHIDKEWESEGDEIYLDGTSVG